MTDKPAIEAILALGHVDFETPAGWRAADLGLRNEVINAVLKIHPAEKIHELRDALVAGRAVQFRDNAIGLTVRWSPG